jgi:hypothetical protein
MHSCVCDCDEPIIIIGNEQERQTARTGRTQTAPRHTRGRTARSTAPTPGVRTLQGQTRGTAPQQHLRSRQTRNPRPQISGHHAQQPLQPHAVRQQHPPVAGRKHRRAAGPASKHPEADWRAEQVIVILLHLPPVVSIIAHAPLGNGGGATLHVVPHNQHSFQQF